MTNIEKVLERGEKIEILVDKTYNLNNSTFAFRNRTTELRKVFWWKKQKVMVLMVLIIVIIFIIITWSLFGIPFVGNN